MRENEGKMKEYERNMKEIMRKYEELQIESLYWTYKNSQRLYRPLLGLGKIPNSSIKREKEACAGSASFSLLILNSLRE